MTALQYSSFKPLEGQAFKLRLPQGGELPLVLARAELRSCHVQTGASRRSEPFSLMFEGTQGVLCQQGSYIIWNETLGEVLIFIVPVANLPDGLFRYQAVFN